MTGLRTEEPLDKIAQDEPGTQPRRGESHQPHDIPETHYAVAEQLVQHSQRARHNGGPDLPRESGQGIEELNDSERREQQQLSRNENDEMLCQADAYRHCQVSPGSVSQESGIKHQPDQLNHPPSLGQTCRFVAPGALFYIGHGLYLT